VGTDHHVRPSSAYRPSSVKSKCVEMVVVEVEIVVEVEEVEMI